MNLEKDNKILEEVLAGWIVEKFMKKFPNARVGDVDVYASQAAKKTLKDMRGHHYDEQVRYGFSLAETNFLMERTF